MERIDSFDFAWAGGGRAALIMDRSTSGVTVRGHDFREDGQKSYQARFFKNGPMAIDRLTIRKQSSTPQEYRGMMFRALWVFMPGGRSISASIEADGTLSRERIGGVSTLIFAVRHRDREIRCDLDEDHGYLPKVVRVKSGGDEQTLSVTRFQSDNGIWFPAEVTGSSRRSSQDGVVRSAIEARIEALEINRPIPPSHFGPQPLQPGCMVIDEAAKKLEIRGGRLARSRLLELHPEPTKPALAADPIRAQRDPDRVPAAPILMVIAAVCGVSAILIRNQRSK